MGELSLCCKFSPLFIELQKMVKCLRELVLSCYLNSVWWCCLSHLEERNLEVLASVAIRIKSKFRNFLWAICHPIKVGGLGIMNLQIYEQSSIGEVFVEIRNIKELVMQDD